MNTDIRYLNELGEDLAQIMTRSRSPEPKRRRRMRRIAPFAVVAATAVIAFFAGSLVGQGPTSASADTVLGQIAQTYATKMGDPTPTSTEYVSTTRQVAVQADGSGTADTNEPVYLVVVKGSFIDKSAFGDGGAPPEGSVLTLVVDVSDYQVVDVGVESVPPTLSGVGATTTLNH
jgi:hypothetical protein